MARTSIIVIGFVQILREHRFSLLIYSIYVPKTNRLFSHSTRKRETSWHSSGLWIDEWSSLDVDRQTMCEALHSGRRLELDGTRCLTTLLDLPLSAVDHSRSLDATHFPLSLSLFLLRPLVLSLSQNSTLKVVPSMHSSQLS